MLCVPPSRVPKPLPISPRDGEVGLDQAPPPASFLRYASQTRSVDPDQGSVTLDTELQHVREAGYLSLCDELDPPVPGGNSERADHPELIRGRRSQLFPSHPSLALVGPHVDDVLILGVQFREAAPSPGVHRVEKVVDERRDAFTVVHRGPGRGYVLSAGAGEDPRHRRSPPSAAP